LNQRTIKDHRSVADSFSGVKAAAKQLASIPEGAFSKCESLHDDRGGFLTFLDLLRIMLGGTAVIGGWTVPMWASWIALIISAYLAYEGFRLSK